LRQGSGEQYIWKSENEELLRMPNGKEGLQAMEIVEIAFSATIGPIIATPNRFK
jgi:hypothetical protein